MSNRPKPYQHAFKLGQLIEEKKNPEDSDEWSPTSFNEVGDKYTERYDELDGYQALRKSLSSGRYEGTQFLERLDRSATDKERKEWTEEVCKRCHAYYLEKRKKPERK